MIVNAHVSPGFRTKTRPQLEQRATSDQPANSGPSPQCGQRLRSPRPSAAITVLREGVMTLTMRDSGTTARPRAGALIAHAFLEGVMAALRGCGRIRALLPKAGPRNTPSVLAPRRSAS